MTEEEKKEFEEFLQWKAEKAKKEEAEKQSADSAIVEGNRAEDVTEEPSQSDTQQNPPVESSKSNTGLGIVFAAVMAIVFLLIMVDQCSKKDSTMPQEQEEYAEVDTIAEVLEVDTSEPDQSSVQWSISTEKDPMTDSKNIWAKIESDDYVTQSFPYEGYTYASITVRYMKKYGYDVLIQITKGQITGNSYNGTNYITARFDDGSPQKYYFNESSDGSSDVVFIRNTSDFIKKCKKAKDIKIDLPLYQGGRPVFSFHVDEPLVWPQD